VSAELELSTIADVPALIRRERAELSEIADPIEIAEAERRAAAIAELTRRAGLAIPVQNEATLYRAEALERLAVVVAEAQENGEIAREGVDGGRPRKLVQASDQFPGLENDRPKTLRALKLDKRRIAEGRALAATDVLDRAREANEKNPDRPLRFADLVRRAERLNRLGASAEKRRRLEQQARVERARQEALGGRPFQLDVGDLRSWRPGSPIHAIITDPPYITGDALELYAALADLAVETLEPGGVLAAMVWPPMLTDVARAMDRRELAYRWSVVWRFSTHNNTGDVKHRVFDTTKFVLVYHRGEMPADAPYLMDYVEATNADKDLHVWQQSLAGFEWLVDHLTWPGQTICDPFTGSGTTAVAALRKERRFVGCDIDAAAVETTLRRLT